VLCWDGFYYVSVLCLSACFSASIFLSLKRWISKSYSHCWKGLKYAKDAGKLNIGQFNCSGQTRDSRTRTQYSCSRVHQLL